MSAQPATRRAGAWSSLLALLGLIMGCGGGVGPGGGTVGATCTSDRQCAHVCQTGDDNYPGGICTVRCASDADCPGGTACVDENGGMCVTRCESNGGCAAFGRGWVCDARDRRGGAGGVLVCRVP